MTFSQFIKALNTYAKDNDILCIVDESMELEELYWDEEDLPNFFLFIEEKYKLSSTIEDDSVFTMTYINTLSDFYSDTHNTIKEFYNSLTIKTLF